MTLDHSIKVGMPSQGVVICPNGKYYLVYHILRSYRDENGSPRSDRVAIGKLDLESGMLIPNAKYWDLYGPAADEETILNYASNRAVGMSFIIGHIMRNLGLTEVLDQCLGVERSGLVQTAALYMVARGNVFEGVKSFCEGFTLHEAPLTSQKLSQLFASITHEERMSFFYLWLQKQELCSYLAYDVTSFSTYANNITKSEYKHNLDNIKLPQINLGCFISESSSLPVFYTVYKGSITDPSELQNMMKYNKSFNIIDVSVVLNRVFCSKKNIKYLKKNNFRFILGVHKNHKIIKEAIKICLPSLKLISNKIKNGLYGVSKPGCFYGVNSNLNIYYDTSLAKNNNKLLLQDIDKHANELSKIKYLTKEQYKKYNRYFSIETNDDKTFIYKKDFGKINYASKYFGIYCVLTDKKLSCAEIYNIYSRRAIIENNFDEAKKPLNMKRLLKNNDATTEGKLFSVFISFIINSEIERKFRELMGKMSWNKNDLVNELESIRLVTSARDTKLMKSVTQLQRIIFETLGLSEEDLKTYIHGSKLPPA